MRALPLRALAALTLLAAAPALAQDRLALGSPAGTGPFTVPVTLSDVAGTGLGVDRPAGSRIQAFAVTVRFDPPSGVLSASLVRAGLLAGRTPLFETTTEGSATVTWVGAFDEAIQPLPFSQPPSGDGDAILSLAVSLAPGATVVATLDAAATTLSNQGGTAGETVGDGSLVLGPGTTLPPGGAAPRVPTAGTAGLLAMASAVAAAGALVARKA